MGGSGAPEEGPRWGGEQVQGATAPAQQQSDAQRGEGVRLGNKKQERRHSSSLLAWKPVIEDRQEQAGNKCPGQQSQCNKKLMPNEVIVPEGSSEEGTPKAYLIA